MLSSSRLEEGEALHVVGEVFEGHFDFRTGEAKRVDHQAAHRRFYVAIDMLNTRSHA